MTKPTVREYLRAVFARDLLSLMSGALSVPFTFAGLYMPNIYAKTLFGLLAITALSVAGYRKWASERNEHLNTQTKLENELQKQGQPRVIVVLNNDEWTRLWVCLTNYTDSPAVNLQAGELRCGKTRLLLGELPAQVSNGFSPNIQVFCPDEPANAREWVGVACGGPYEEPILFTLRYTDQEARYEWMTSCQFHFNWSAKKFVIDKQWVEKAVDPGRRTTDEQTTS